MVGGRMKPESTRSITRKDLSSSNVDVIFHYPGVGGHVQLAPITTQGASRDINAVAIVTIPDTRIICNSGCRITGCCASPQVALPSFLGDQQAEMVPTSLMIRLACLDWP
jgi:hypothetical protein